MKRLFVLLILVTLPWHWATAQDLNVVPSPLKVVHTNASAFKIPSEATIANDAIFGDAVALFRDNLGAIHNIRTTAQAGNTPADIELISDKTMAEEAYHIEVSAQSITLKAANHHAMTMALTTLLQMMDTERGEIPACRIDDAPAFAYRSYMLDLARQWVEVPTIKQIIDLCRWYKVRYLQLHLTDDPLFTFQSAAFPALATENRSYTRAQLVDLVAYAEQRGVTLVPEFDLPGHSQSLRRAMPSLFGELNYGLIDLTKPEVFEAVKTIAREMMDIFSSSPYFHIGADETNLSHFKTLPHVQEYVEKKGYDDAHDAYLEFIVKMHAYVKSQGFKTLVWESFPNAGSDKVKIPKDIIVLAWETLYQEPQSILDNGYTMINSTWKPNYMTPGWRWSPQYIYEWNARRWENHWVKAPSFQRPIEVAHDSLVLGVQMNAWEMIDHEQYIAARERMAAFSETAWNSDKKDAYADYLRRFHSADKMLSRLTFPAKITQQGCLNSDPMGLDDNRANCFRKQASVVITPDDPANFITYTTDGSLPTAHSTKLTTALTMDKPTIVKFALYNPAGELKGYKSVNYALVPLQASHQGETKAVLNPNILKPSLLFKKGITLRLTNHLGQGTLRYTTDGSKPTATSLSMPEAVAISKECQIRAQLFVNGTAVGREYNCLYKLTR